MSLITTLSVETCHSWPCTHRSFIIAPMSIDRPSGPNDTPQQRTFYSTAHTTNRRGRSLDAPHNRSNHNNGSHSTDLCRLRSHRVNIALVYFIQIVFQVVVDHTTDSAHYCDSGKRSDHALWSRTDRNMVMLYDCLTM